MKTSMSIIVPWDFYLFLISICISLLLEKFPLQSFHVVQAQDKRSPYLTAALDFQILPKIFEFAVLVGI